MKNIIIKTIGKLLMVAAVAAGLTGLAMAQKPQKSDNLDKQQVIEQIRQELKKNFERGTVESKNALKITGGNVSVNSRTNFNIGSEFVFALYEADYVDEGETGNMIIELVHLIDYLEGQPEAASLQKTLKSVVRGTADGAQIRKDLEAASKSYLSRLNAEQKWYVNSGSAVTNLLFSTYIGDEPEMKKGLSEIQSLIKIAPQGTSAQILDPMNILAKYIAQTTFSEKDYTAIFEGAMDIVDSVNA